MSNMIYNIKSPTEMAGFYIVYDGSTLLETPGLRGASHLLEHLMTKTYEHLQDELQARCVKWNAYTSNNEVVFLLQGLESEVNLFRRRLLASLTEFPITEQQFQTERSIVLQEYRDTFSDPYWTHIHNVERLRFGYYSPIGLRQDLEDLTLEKLREYWSQWFTKPTKIINVSNRYQHFESRPMPRVAVLDKALRPADRTTVTLEPNPQVKDNSVVLLQTDPVETDVPALKVAAACLSSGLNSPLYQEIRVKRGLCYGVWVVTYRYNDQHLVNVSANVSDANSEEMVKVTREVLANPRRYVTAERLELVRQAMLLQEQIDAINRYDSVDLWLVPERFLARSVVNDITLEEVHAAIEKHLHPDRMTVFVDKNGYA